MVDVCLILEGTYPYVTGGVSAWVQTLLAGLPDLTFAVVHLSAGDGKEAQARYLPPPNLAEFVEWPLDLGEARVWSRERSEGRQLPLSLAPPLPCSSARLPQAQVYHALSTGFAGLLGCQVKTVLGRPLILTEHGIYWREVQAGADELECGFRVVPAGQDAIRNPQFEIRNSKSEIRIAERALRDHWTIALQDAARQAYWQADAITTVCQANARLQAALGAPSSRCHVIHNGVDWRALAPGELRSPAAACHFGYAQHRPEPRRRDDAHRIGFVGRVVSIKDVATFLRACRLVAGELPGAEFYVIGPTDHDPAYVAHCQRMVAELGLSERVTFTGETDPVAWYRRLDVVVLTSLSEGQPLVLLEAMAAGVPVVTTAVGGCPELVQGATAQDRALGPSGLLTPVGDPRATARAILALCRDADRWHQSSRAGQERVRHFYTTDQLCRAYRTLYERWLSNDRSPSGFNADRQGQETLRRACPELCRRAQGRLFGDHKGTFRGLL